MSARAGNASGDGTKQGLQLHAITPSDIEEVARFILRMSETSGETGVPARPANNSSLRHAVERLSWILAENPARSPEDPLGWLLRTPAGDIVGCMGCAPQEFCLGQTIFTLMMANSFYVDDCHRGSGTSILLKYLQLGSRYPLFVSSANPTVAEMWKKLGGYPLANSEEELLAILRWSPLLAEGVVRKTKSNLLARLTDALASPWFSRNQFGDIPQGDLFPLNTPEEAAKLCAEHHSDKITSCRDLPFLKWRYFSPVEPTTRLFAFRPRGAEKRFTIAARLQNRGYKQQIRALHVLDIWGEPADWKGVSPVRARSSGADLESAADANPYLAIASALCHEYREQADVLIFRCINSQHKKILTSHGFKVRRFAAPIAWCIDKHGLLPAKEWYFVPADGDMFL